MAMNPMQRKANNYLLIGVLVTLLITGSIIVLLFMKLNTLQKEKQAEKSSMKNVYVVSKDVKSGEKVSLENLKQKSVSSSILPKDTLNVADLTDDTIAKIDLSAGTVVTSNMVSESDEKTTDDLRKQEYNMVILPSQIQNGDYIDIRIKFSNGVDYIVASKKKVEIPEVENPTSYIDKGSLLYATTYIEPGLQKTLIPTYVPTGAVQSALNSNANITQEAKNGLFARYNQNASTRTGIIDSALAQYAQDRVNNIEAGVQEEIAKAKEARSLYLESLGGY